MASSENSDSEGAQSDRGKVHDPLKPLDKIFSKDRDFAGGANIEQHHAQLSAISLHERVPVEVRQLFETAKNISLYSHFAYRLHQPAELIGFIAFEKALRLKAEKDAPDVLEKRHTRLIKIVRRAIEDGWFRYENLSGPRSVATHRARQKKLFEMLHQDMYECEVPEPTEAEILAELELMNGMAEKLEVTLKLRNILAHGYTGLSPTSVSGLARTAELINQLF